MRNEDIRYNIVNALGTWPLSESAESAVPSLIVLLHDQSWRVRGEAASSLAAIGKPSELIVPALIAALKNENLAVRIDIISSLGALGSRAKLAIPELMTAINASNIDERLSALHAVKEIDPAAAASLHIDLHYENRTN